ncbi:MAG TPA: hypothetical protein VKZ63_21830 [Kofleriaceae bacterium]|nr:hypothetical protein [Kofleriaceae bacterium]
MPSVRVVHALPGRTRLLIEPRDPDAIRRIGAALADAAGVREVRARPLTGSLLCLHDDELDPDRLVALARAQGDGAAGSPQPECGPPVTSSIARELARLFRALNCEILRQTSGTADLGMLLTVGFFTAGAIDVARTGKVPPPPWFNLAWWGFRTFMTLEGGAIQESRSSGTAAASGSVHGTEDDERAGQADRAGDGQRRGDR